MNSTQIWYASLIKPSWAPPPSVFGPVWTVLYIIIAVTFITAFYKIYKGEWPRRALVPFGLNLLSNLLYTPIQFGLHNNVLAAVDILVVLATLVWLLKVSSKRTRWIALANIPYLLWVTFATILQLSIVWFNIG